MSVAPSKKNPYVGLPKTAFWRSGVADVSPFSIFDLWKPKHDLNKSHKIVTAGSCFAQHIGKALSKNGYSWFNAEPAPHKFDETLAREYNYGIFSFRTGNIYTASALKQWIFWALGKQEVPTEVWEHDGRFYDPFRPAIEPGGFLSAEEMFNSREATLAAIRTAIKNCDRFVFTMGLTEGWVNKSEGYSYAMCPGTLAGDFDPQKHVFKNFMHSEIRKDLADALKAIREENPKVRCLLTVSPVPLTATASGEHVLTATTYSKSALRSVAGELSSVFGFIDYFPSYEIITAPCFRGMFYEPNMRSVHADGVDFVMRSFFQCLASQTHDTVSENEAVIRQDASAVQPVSNIDLDENENEVVCEEMLLDAFGRN